MRCISPHTFYSIVVIGGQEEIIQDARGFAKTVELKQAIQAQFRPTGLTDNEEFEALSKFTFSGLPEGVNPLSTVGVFDSEAYCLRYPKDRRDEIQVQMDKRLRDLQVQNPTQFIIVDPPAAPKPWPSYDEMTVEDILKFQEVLRVEPDLIRLYELENANRPEIVSAMLWKSDPNAARRYEAGLRGEATDDDEHEFSVAGVGDGGAGLRAALEGVEEPKQEIKHPQDILDEGKPPTRVIVDA